ncbi:MAG: cytochrome c [Boseongicola sp.]|nr:cytochrome c [Boseongicola sp.]
MKLVSFIAAAAFICLAGPLSADPIEDGRTIYAERCVVCHGDAGAGDGMVGELFAVRPKNLANLADENNGAFPFSEVYQAIDGRREIAGHGRSEMPVWGDFFMESAIDDRSINEKNARYITQGRILSLVYYLQSIQSN